MDPDECRGGIRTWELARNDGALGSMQLLIFAGHKESILRSATRYPQIGNVIQRSRRNMQQAFAPLENIRKNAAPRWTRLDIVSSHCVSPTVARKNRPRTKWICSAAGRSGAANRMFGPGRQVKTFAVTSPADKSEVEAIAHAIIDDSKIGWRLASGNYAAAILTTLGGGRGCRRTDECTVSDLTRAGILVASRRGSAPMPTFEAVPPRRAESVGCIPTGVRPKCICRRRWARVGVSGLRQRRLDGHLLRLTAGSAISSIPNRRFATLYREQSETGRLPDVTENAGVPGSAYGMGMAVGDLTATVFRIMYVTQYAQHPLSQQRRRNVHGRYGEGRCDGEWLGHQRRLVRLRQ